MTEKNRNEKKIVEKTIRLIQAQGFEAMTMEQVAKEVDISKGTLYNYYSVKEAIISDYIKILRQSRASWCKNKF